MQLCTLLNKLFFVLITMDLNFKTIFLWHMVSATENPVPRAAKPITPPYVENNYRIEVKITFMLIAYLVLLCECFWEFSIFHFCRPLVDIYWHPLLSVFSALLETSKKTNKKLLQNIKDIVAKNRIKNGGFSLTRDQREDRAMKIYCI